MLCCLLYRENHSQTHSSSLNNNNEESSSTISSMAGSSDVKEKADEHSKVQQCKNNQPPLQKCDSWDLRHSGNNPCKVFHVKTVEVTDIKSKVVNGHRHKVRNGHVSTSPSVGSCCIELVCSSSSDSQRSSASPVVNPSPCTQLTKAAKISPSSAAPSDDSLDAFGPKNGNRQLVQLARGPPPKGAPSLESSKSCNQHHTSTTVSNTSCPVTSHLGGEDQKNKSLCSAFFLLNQENSSSSVSSLVSLSSQEDSSAVPDDKSTNLRTCNWKSCGKELEPAELMEHIQSCHVRCQDGESFVCLWNGCKVYNKSSSSRRWLERHILGHSGDKPFRCIVDKCGMQFTSQYGLERHVNSHFDVSRPTSSKPGRHKEDTPSKLSKKKKVKRKRALPGNLYPLGATILNDVYNYWQ